MAQEKRDYYEVLGVSKGASEDEIKKAVDFIGGMDIRAVSERVMHELFKALAMRFEFTL